MYDDVIFSAYKNDSHDIVIDYGNYMEDFNGFLVNFGNGFLLPNGTFTAPRKGIYEFSVDAHARPNTILTVQCNGANELSFVAYTSQHTSSMSFSWIMELEQEDTVKLFVKEESVYCDPSYNCIFSGKLIKN